MKPLLLPLLLLATSGLLPAAPEKPNVIFLLADDMGWGDLGVFYQNSRGTSPKFATPNLDTIAAEGMQLRRHYCPAPVCAPSRASLLLGVHQGHANVRDNSFDKALENNHTLGTVMKQAGYATAMIGKYGLQGSGLPAPARPQLRGFDFFFGFLEHGDAHFHYPKETGVNESRDVNFYDGTTDITSQLDKCYSTDLITARSKKWIVDQTTTSPDQPFFLYLALTAPHARLDVPTQAYPAGKGLSGGLQWTGTPGAMTNTASGTINSYIHPDYAGETTWPDYAKRHATMIRRIDDAIADLIQTLKDLNVDNHTMIVFTSDNGPHNEAGTGGSYTYNPTYFDSFGPMDGIKRDTWEGGMREPTLVRWPGHVTAGTISLGACQFHDWMPTLAEIAGVPAPARTDGVSLVPTLTGAGPQRESTIYVEYQYSGTTPSYTEFEASRRGATRGQEQVIHLEGYKGIRYNLSTGNEDFQIYNTLADAKEATNLAGSNAYFSGLQQRMKDRVLQVRRPGGGVSRPYDSANVPPAAAATVTGLAYRVFEDAFPWVPDFTPLSPTASGNCTGLDLSVRTRDSEVGLLYTGYLEAPSDGTYTLYLTTDSKAFLRLHDAAVLDADFGYTGGTEISASINLKAGKHPLRLSYVRGSGGSPALDLKWSGPGISKQAIPTANLLRAGNDPVPPTANPDTTTTTSGFPATIAVLNNDTVGSGPGPLAITGVSVPSHGTTTLVGTTAVAYTPAAGYTGPDTFTYTLSDGSGTATGTVNVSVVAAIPPVAYPDTATTTAGNGVTIAVLANDTDDGAPSPLALASVSHPTGGTAVVSGSNILYTPFAGVYGGDRFDYTITDGQNVSSAAVTVTVGRPPGSAIWLPLDETDGVTTRDAGGTEIGTLIGFPTEPWTTGRLGGALIFDGVDDRVVLTNQKGITGTAARTVTFWLNADATQSSGHRPTMVSWGGNNGTTAGIRFDINLNHTNGYKLRAEFNSSGLNFTTGTRSDLRGAGWVHCAIVVPAGATVSQVRGYIDGVLATTTIEPSSSAGTAINTSSVNDITLGRLADGTASRALTGMLDDVRIQPGELGAAEIAALASQTPDANLQSRWHYQHTGIANPDTAAWLADTDGDGFSARLEFALGGNPTAPTRDISPVLSGDLATFTFNRRRTGIAASSYIPEISTDLTPESWAPLGPPTVAPHPELPDFDRVSVTLPAGNDPRRFLRLRVAP